VIRIETILVPLDFSAHSRRALQYAIDLAGQLGSSLHLLHALHVPVDVRLTGDGWADLRQAPLEGLQICMGEVAAAGLKCETHLSDEYPATAIVQLAEEVGADLIVMGSRGLSGIKHVLLGSVAERTIRSAPCPVLTVVAGEEERAT
jgi:nucleotide-binding universal stress UspA family protein